MANVIRLKRASGSDPVASDLVSGEPAVRTDTGELFFKKDDGSVAKVSGAGGGPDFKYLALRNAANNGAASYPNADFTLVTSGTTNSITPTAANTLLVSVNGVIQKPNTGTSTPSSGFALSGSTIKFGANLSAAPDFILYQESGGIGEPSNETVSEAKLKVSNSPVNGYFLSAQSGNTGGLTWAAPVATSCTGNSATATALATARAINGVDFDGTAAITVTAAAGTLTGTTLKSTVVTSSLTSLGDLSGLTVNGNSSLRHILAQTDSTYDIGTTSTRYRNVYADAYYGDGSNLTGISAGVTSDAQDNTVAGTNAGDSFDGTNAEANTLYGKNAGTAITTGDQSTCVGKDAGKSISTAARLTAIGHRAGEDVTGQNNTIVGANSGLSLTSGQSNVIMGVGAADTGTGFSFITAIGAGALASSSHGQNTAVGYNAGKNASNNCTFVGYKAGENATGNSNTIIGDIAFSTTNSGNQNTAVGYEALYSYNDTGTNPYQGSVAVGRRALLSATNGNHNVAVGRLSAYSVSTGDENVILGALAGYGSDGTGALTTGENNILIGFEVLPSAADIDNEITLGNSSITKFRIPGLNFSVSSNAVINGGVFYENAQTVSSNYTMTTGNNAMAAGQITINNGVTVTIPSNSTLTIV